MEDNKSYWWQSAVFYQIYPMSFRDSDGDGIGDLRGITEKLGYIRSIGADAIWINPIYRSPGADNGYDISDYRDIDPRFGTLGDFKALLERAHSLGLRVVMDLVVNHTSDEHEWFRRARTSRDDPYHDYYIWSESASNWQSIFGGSAWEYNEPTREYYLHLFAAKQPDLNWENPAVRREVTELIKYWKQIGVDGFRIDTVNMYSKTPGLPNVEKPRVAFEHFCNGPRIHDYLRELYANGFETADFVTIGEASGLSPEQTKLYCGRDRRELSMVIWFEHMHLDLAGDEKWDHKPVEPERLARVLSSWQRAMADDGWLCIYFGNHDQPRMVSRFGDGSHEYHDRSAKLLAALLFTLRGTPFIYQGDELGMTNCRFEFDEYKDVEVKNALNTHKFTLKFVRGLEKMNRDNARTPMQWSAEENAGFTKGKPWIKVNPNYTTINAAAEEDDPNSILNAYRALAALRRAHPALVLGDYAEAECGRALAFTRSLDGETLFIAANLSRESVPLALPEGETLLANAELETRGELPPYAAFIIKTE